jgi:hypothetical protein
MRNEVIPDAPPAGYIPLSAAFDRFWNEHAASIKQEEATPSCDFQPPVMEDDRARWATRQAAAMDARTKIYQAFLRYLRGGQLKAIVCHPTTREKMPIPPEAWVTAWFPQRPLVALIISGEEGEEFKAYVGRTPFVSEAQLAIVLEHSKVSSCHAPEVEQPRVSGSKAGSGSYASADAPLIARMDNLLWLWRLHQLTPRRETWPRMPTVAGLSNP